MIGQLVRAVPGVVFQVYGHVKKAYGMLATPYCLYKRVEGDNLDHKKTPHGV